MTKSFCQEKTLRPKVVNKPPDPATAITKTIGSINTIRNGDVRFMKSGRHIRNGEFLPPDVSTTVVVRMSVT